MRTAYGIYRGLQIYLENFANDPELDEHFKSGVQLGTGLSSLMLSLLPSKVMKVSHGFPWNLSEKFVADSYRLSRSLSCLVMVEIGKWPSKPSRPLEVGKRVKADQVFRRSKKASGEQFAIWLF